MKTYCLSCKKRTDNIDSQYYQYVFYNLNNKFS